MTDSTKPATLAAFCSNCGALKPALTDLCADSKNGQPFTDLVCAECRAILLTCSGHINLAATPAATDERELFEAAWERGDIDTPARLHERYDADYVEQAEKDAAWQGWQAARAQLAAPPTVPEAMAVVTQAMRDDPEYAWGWHCNIAMSYVDAGGDHAIGNHGAARFLRLLANVEPAHELPALSAPASQAGRDALDAAAERAIEHALRTVGMLSSLGGSLAVDAGVELFQKLSRAALAGTPGAPMEQRP